MNAISRYGKTLKKKEFDEWAARAGTVPMYIRQMMYGVRTPSPELCKKLCEACDWAIHPVEVLPLVFDGIPKYKAQKEMGKAD